MALDVGSLIKELLDGLLKELGRALPNIRAYAEKASKQLADEVIFIGQEYAAGRMDEEHAKTLLAMQKNAAKAVLLTIAGLEALQVEKALNKALGFLRDLINKTVGFEIIPPAV